MQKVMLVTFATWVISVLHQGINVASYVLLIF